MDSIADCDTDTDSDEENYRTFPPSELAIEIRSRILSLARSTEEIDFGQVCFEGGIKRGMSVKKKPVSPPALKMPTIGGSVFCN